MDGYLGQVMIFAGNFPPRNWEFCEGQLLPIASNQALFSILGTFYGGDGRTTFGLPDLRSRIPVGLGAAPGLTQYYLGQKGGFERVPLSLAEMPVHDHGATAAILGAGSVVGTAIATMEINDAANDKGENGTGAYLGYSDGGPLYASTANKSLNPAAITVNTTGLGVDLSNAQVGVTVHNNGASNPHYNIQPFLAMHWIICTDGLYPQRH